MKGQVDREMLHTRNLPPPVGGVVGVGVGVGVGIGVGTEHRFWELALTVLVQDNHSCKLLTHDPTVDDEPHQ